MAQALLKKFFLHERTERVQALESLPDFRGHVRRSRDNGHHIFESPRRHQNGIAFPVRVNLANHQDVSGSPEFHSLMVHDLSVPPQKEFEERTTAPPQNMATCHELRFVRIINHAPGRNL